MFKSSETNINRLILSQSAAQARLFTPISLFFDLADV